MTSWKTTRLRCASNVGPVGNDRSGEGCEEPAVVVLDLLLAAALTLKPSLRSTPGGRVAAGSAELVGLCAAHWAAVVAARDAGGEARGGMQPEAAGAEPAATANAPRQGRSKAPPGRRKAG